MRIDDAIAQIAEIHQHLDRNEVFRGYRAVPVLISAVVALLGASLQPLLVHGDIQFVWFWIGIATINIAICGIDILSHYLRDDGHRRRQARRTMAQLLPSLGVGLMLTAILLLQGGELIPWLPGLWTALFGLGLLSARPNLPRAIGWVGCFYVLAGGGLLCLADSGASLSPWGMGATFGLGQLAAARVLHRNVERQCHEL